MIAKDSNWWFENIKLNTGKLINSISYLFPHFFKLRFLIKNFYIFCILYIFFLSKIYLNIYLVFPIVYFLITNIFFFNYSVRNPSKDISKKGCSYFSDLKFNLRRVFFDPFHFENVVFPNLFLSIVVLLFIIDLVIPFNMFKRSLESFSLFLIVVFQGVGIFFDFFVYKIFIIIICRIKINRDLLNFLISSGGIRL